MGASVRPSGSVHPTDTWLAPAAFSIHAWTAYRRPARRWTGRLVWAAKFVKSRGAVYDGTDATARQWCWSSPSGSSSSRAVSSAAIMNR